MVMPDNDSKHKCQHSIKLPYLYKEGSKILQAHSEKKGSLKSLVYATRQPKLFKRLLALVCRAVDNQRAIDSALSAVGLLSAEPGLAASTARLLTAELLYGSGRLPAEARPALTVLRYADRLRAAAAADGARPDADRRPALPRYARINTLLASVDDVIQQLTAEGWERVEYPPEVTYEQFIAQVKSLCEGQFLVDLHVPCLLVFPPGTELHQHPLYGGGQLILQDKASCLPAVVLAPSPGQHVVDACSAPGMKTSQLAAMMNNKGTLVAVERDPGRFQTLSAMLKKAGTTNTRLVNGDFLKLKPQQYPDVTAILLDPSCSGTGMVGREPEEPPSEERLRRLANLQGMLLRHALSFPAVTRVVYSTCSVTEHENEQVVASTLAGHPDWRLAAAAPATWRRRGRTTLADGERCIRAEPSADLCHGFFVAAFERIPGGCADKTSGHKKKKKRKQSEERRSKDGPVSAEAGGNKEEPCSDKTEEVGETAAGVEDDPPKMKKKKKKRKRSETPVSDGTGVETQEVGGNRRFLGATGEVMSEGICNEEPKKKKKKSDKQKRSEMFESGDAIGVSVEENGGKRNLGANGSSSIDIADGVSCGEPRKKKKREKQKQSEMSESGETIEVSLEETGGERNLSANGSSSIDMADGVSCGEPRKKKKREKQKRSEMSESGETIEVSLEENGGERNQSANGTSSIDMPDGVSCGEPRKKKKREKQKRSETSERGETMEASVQENGGKRSLSANDKSVTDMSDGVPCGEPRKKKKREQTEGPNSGMLSEIPIEVNGTKNVRRKISKSEVPPCVFPVESEKKKRRGGTIDDETEGADAVPAKRRRGEEICIDASSHQTAKKRKKSRRVSKRRRDVLKRRLSQSSSLQQDD